MFVLEVKRIHHCQITDAKVLLCYALHPFYNMRDAYRKKQLLSCIKCTNGTILLFLCGIACYGDTAVLNFCCPFDMLFS